MKNSKLIFAIITILFLITSCAINKETSTLEKLEGTWELEYISGPRIAFKGLYPNKKPTITFDKISKKVTGNDSCNGYTADFNVVENTISFGEPGPTTMMFCGEGEKVFLNMMKKINKYSIDPDGKLNLMIDDVPVMRFKHAVGQ
jgi:heat shock protein HslJ